MEICETGIMRRLLRNQPFYLIADCGKNNRWVDYNIYTTLKEAKRWFGDEKGEYGEHIELMRLYKVHDGRYELIEEYKA